MTDVTVATPSIVDAPRAVLDTSVLISEWRHRLWTLARNGFFEAVWSTFIVAELVRVRMQLSIRRNTEASIYRAAINNLVHRLSDVLIVAPYRNILLSDVLPDVDDEPILAAALAVRASFIVSLDAKHFPTGSNVLGVRFLHPEDFLALLADLYPNDDVPRLGADAGKQLP